MTFAVREQIHSYGIQREREQAENASIVAQGLGLRLVQFLAKTMIDAKQFSDARKELFNMEHLVAETANADMPIWDASSRDTQYLETLINRQSPTRFAGLADGHWPILCAALHRDERWLVTGDSGGRLVVWDLQIERVVHRLLEPRQRYKDGPMKSLRMDAHYLLSRDAELGGILTWEPCAADVEWLPSSGMSIVVASLNGQAIRYDLSDLTRGEQQRELFRADESLYAVGVAPVERDNASRLLFGGERGGLFICDAEVGEYQRSRPVESAVSVIRYCGGADCWLVGYENGEVYGLERTTLEPRFHLQVNGPAWDIAIFEEPESALVAVVGGSERIITFRVARGQVELTDWNEGRFSVEPGQKLAHLAARFTSDGETLITLNDNHRWTMWPSPFRRHSLVQESSYADPRWEKVVELVEQSGRVAMIPLPLRRRATDVLLLNDDRDLIVVNECSSLSRWKMPSAAKPVQRLLNSRLGGDARTAFSSVHDNVLWAAIREGKTAGQLQVIDVDADRRLDSVVAHPGGCQ
ncbi:MAG: hypothetical protein KDA71_23990, partial [Planctomycetales bacterium]|nr:hypothetical protein [Planctomycetales bacterium]